MKKKLLPFLIILLFGFIFVVFYKGLDDTNIYTPDIKVKNDIPKFNTQSFFSGVNLNSSDIFEINKVYLLNIWSSWCLPCRDEHPLIMSLKESKKLGIIGLNYKDKNKNAKKFIDDLGNPYSKILLDNDGTIAIEWGAYGVPETFLIFDNKIIKKYIGPLNPESVLEIKNYIK